MATPSGEWEIILKKTAPVAETSTAKPITVAVSLPLQIRSSGSLVTFQSRLKSHLFSSAYHV